MLWSTGTPWQRVKYGVPTGISGLTPTGKRERYPPNFGPQKTITPLNLCLFQSKKGLCQDLESVRGSINAF